jgi:hypothetical protein
MSHKLCVMSHIGHFTRTLISHAVLIHKWINKLLNRTYYQALSDPSINLIYFGLIFLLAIKYNLFLFGETILQPIKIIKRRS